MKIFSDQEQFQQSNSSPVERPVEKSPERSAEKTMVQPQEQAGDQTNHVSARLDEEDKRAIQEAINVIKDRLHFLAEFTDEERKSMMHLGKTGRNFIGRALDLVQNSPGVLPRSFDEDEFAGDALLYAEMGEIGDQLAELHQKVVDTEAAVGMDAFTAALVVYQSGKLARTGSEMDGGLPGLEKRLGGDPKA